MVERALVVEQAQQQRPDVRARAVLVPAEPGDDAVGGALVLDLEHRPLAGLVGPSSRLATTPSRPAPSNRSNQSAAVARSRVAGVRWTGGCAPPRTASRRARRSPCGTSRRSSSPSASRSQATNDAGRLLGQHLDPRRRRVDAQQQRLEVEAAVARDDDLAVEHAALGQRGAERVGQLGEVAVQRLEVARLRVDLVAVAEDERPEAVPLRLEQPAVVGRQAVGRPWRASARAAARRAGGGPSPECTASRAGSPAPPAPARDPGSRPPGRRRPDPPRARASLLQERPERRRVRPGGSRQGGDQDRDRRRRAGPRGTSTSSPAWPSAGTSDGSMTRSTLRSATNDAGASTFSPTSATTPMTASPWPSQRVRSEDEARPVATSATPSATMATST